MHAQTQADRLATLMAKQSHIPSYELALPLVTVRSSSLKSLASGDVLLLGLAHLECLLIKDDMIRAKVCVEHRRNTYCLKVEQIEKEMICSVKSKKHEILLLTCGKLQSRILEVGHTIEINESHFRTIDVIVKEKKIAEASLVNIDGEIAIQIDKVKNNE